MDRKWILRQFGVWYDHTCWEIWPKMKQFELVITKKKDDWKKVPPGRFAPQVIGIRVPCSTEWAISANSFIDNRSDILISADYNAILSKQTQKTCHRFYWVSVWMIKNEMYTECQISLNGK